MRDLRATLAHCISRLSALAAHDRIGEQNTKATIIEPILEALGWDVRDHRVVYREYRRRPSDNPVDYALFVDDRPALFVEAKGYGENIDDPRWSAQVISYAAVAGIDWVVLTDGAQWRLFNAHARVPVEDKELRRSSLLDDMDDAADMLALLSPGRTSTGELSALWRIRQGERAAAAVLSDVFHGGRLTEELITELVRRGAAGDDEAIRQSLRGVRLHWTWTPSADGISRPDVVAPSAPAMPEATAIDASGASRATRRNFVGENERAIKVSDLLGSGRVRPGTLTARYMGQDWRGELRADGWIVVAGVAYSSPSGAGAAVKVQARGPNIPESVRATDGWDFWIAVDTKDGRSANLKTIRRRLTQGL